MQVKYNIFKYLHMKDMIDFLTFYGIYHVAIF